MTQRPQGKCHRKSLSLIEQSSLTRKPCRSMEPAPQRALASPFVCRVYSFTQLAGSATFGKQKKSRVNKFTIVFQECEEGGFTAYIKEFPGAISEGETAVEAGLNAFDALVQLLAAQAEEQLKNLDVTPHEVELAFA